jgi:adenine-specific DNA-methyltransferase
LILDSFAGSGTTAHAVLKANAKDGGTRRFILVECEDYADRLTAERVRRAIKGYAWVGHAARDAARREDHLQPVQEGRASWLAEGRGDQAREKAWPRREPRRPGRPGQRDAAAPLRRIEAKVEDGVLRVEGVRRVSQMAPGLGGELHLLHAGRAAGPGKLLSGERCRREALGAWLFHTATGGTLAAAADAPPEWYLGEAADRHVWLIYRPELHFLKSPRRR